MHRHPILALFALLAIFTGTAAADVFIYKGIGRGRISLGPSNVTPPLVRTYIVVDFETGEACSISYFNKGGKKLIAGLTNVNTSRATLPNAKTASLISFGTSSNTALNNFSRSTILLQGTDVSLLAEKVPTPRTVARPRLLIGGGISASASDPTDGQFQLVNFSMTLQSALTIAANNENKTMATVRDELVALLENQGYVAL